MLGIGGHGRNSLAAVVENDGHSTPQARAAFRRARQQAIEQADYDPDGPGASEIYYLLFRSSIHGGLNRSASDRTALNPLAAPLITCAGKAARSNRLVYDLTLLLEPEMVVAEYDRPGRNMTNEQVSERLSELGGTVDADHEVVIRGHPAQVSVGITQLRLSVAKELGFSGSELSDAANWFNEDVQRLPRSLREHYRRIHKNGVWMLGKVGGHVQSAVPSLAKAAGLRGFAALG